MPLHRMPCPAVQMGMVPIIAADASGEPMIAYVTKDADKALKDANVGQPSTDATQPGDRAC